MNSQIAYCYSCHSYFDTTYYCPNCYPVGTADSNVNAVIKKMKQRAIIDFTKCKTTTDRTDLTTRQWLQHAQEEAVDLAIYLQKLINEQT